MRNLAWSLALVSLASCTQVDTPTTDESVAALADPVASFREIFKDHASSPIVTRLLGQLASIYGGGTSIVSPGVTACIRGCNERAAAAQAAILQALIDQQATCVAAYCPDASGPTCVSCESGSQESQDCFACEAPFIDAANRASREVEKRRKECVLNCAPPLPGTDGGTRPDGGGTTPGSDGGTPGNPGITTDGGGIAVPRLDASGPADGGVAEF